MYHHIDVTWRSYLKIQEVFQSLEKTSAEIITPSFTIIIPLEPVPINIVSKLEMSADNLPIAEVFYYLQSELSQFCFLANAHNDLVRAAIHVRVKDLNTQGMAEFRIRIKEIKDLLLKMLLTSEAIFDQVSFMASKLEMTRQGLKRRLEGLGCKDIKMAQMIINPHHAEMRQKLKHFLDDFQEYKGRHLWMFPIEA